MICHAHVIGDTLTMDMWPSNEAQCKGVSPLLSWRSILAPLSMSI